MPKFSGNAQYVKDGRVMHHGTILFDSDSSMLSGALQVDEAKIRAKGVQSVRSRVGNIHDYLKDDMSLYDFWRFLKEELTGLGTVSATLPPESLEEIEALKRNKYDTWDWNFGRSPKYTLHNKRRFGGGGVEVFLTAENGIVKEISFFGDYLSVCPMAPVQQALAGCPFRREAVERVLSSFPLADYFGSIALEELSDLIFHATENE